MASWPSAKSIPTITRSPKEDREALLAEEAAHAEEEAALRAADEGDDEFGGDDEHGGDDRGGMSDDFGGEEGLTEIDTSEKDQIATIEGGHVDNGFEYAEEGRRRSQRQ